MRIPDGTVLSWDAPERFTLCVPEGESGWVQAALLGAALWWNEGGLATPLFVDPLASCALDAEDGVVALHRIRTAEDWPDAFGPSNLVAAITLHTFDTRTGIIDDADVAINELGFVLAPHAAHKGSVDLGYVIAHELGHVLGVGHPCGDPHASLPSCHELDPEQSRAIADALMFPSTPTGAREASLSDDDLAALSAIWPGLLPPMKVQAVLQGDRVKLSTTEGVESWAVLRPQTALEWLPPNADATVELELELLLLRSTQGASSLIAITPENTTPPPSESADDCSCQLGHRWKPTFWFWFLPLLLFLLRRHPTRATPRQLAAELTPKRPRRLAPGRVVTQHPSNLFRIAKSE
ncbi:MAG: hypothetical protein RBU37_11475 [Myxococcota bacterium]|jgi:hypothetical protein|nr:hypothetical protein [Myxococcota bacterium]